MFEIIKNIIENKFNQSLNDNITARKLFCGIAYKYTYKNQKEIAKFLNISKSLVSYYIKKHSHSLSFLEYNKLYKELDKMLIDTIESI